VIGADRSTFLSGLIGAPWAAGGHGPNFYDCWHLVVYVQSVLFGRELPAVDVPAAPSWAWMISTIRDHGERARWRELAPGVLGLIDADDGALVLMARCDRPAHIGVWLAIERGVIHADARIGVTLQSLAIVKAAGWAKLRFYQPATEGVQPWST
jgi:cell wall-associated NlpC family hydrolase